jgi:hypothetical protein
MATFPPVIARAEFKKRSGITNLDVSPLHVSCGNPECQKTVPSDMKWYCGFCDFSNRRTGLFSFLNKCQECGKSPKAYLCPHCQEMNFLDKDMDASNPARLFIEARKGPPKESMPQESARAKKRREHSEQIEDIKQEIEKEEHLAKLAQVRAPVDPNKDKTPRERLKEMILARVGKDTNLASVIREVRKEEAEKCKDDPEGLEDLRISLDSIKTELLGPQ